MGFQRKGFIRVGPWIMQEHHSRSIELLKDFAAIVGGGLLRIGMLGNNITAVKKALECGFTENSFSWRMILGTVTRCEVSEGVYAIASPARG